MVNIFGDRGLQGPRGPTGPVGGSGPVGPAGIQGPAGPIGSVDYGYFGVSALKHLPIAYRSKVLTLAETKKKCSFIVGKRNLEYHDASKITKWKDLVSGSALVQPNPQFMARYGKEKDIQYLSFTTATYRIDNVSPAKDCCMLIVYRLKAPRKTSNDYVMIGDGDSSKPRWKTIGFSGSHSQLMITDCNGEMMKLDTFPKSSPLTSDVWNCLCVKWTAGGNSSVWVNAKKVKSFISGDNSTSPVILGGRFVDDDTGFHGDVALFQVYNTTLKDEEIFMLQNKYCNQFKIQSDDGDFLYSPYSPTGVITDLCRWMPQTMLNNLHEVEEQGCFMITDLKKDIHKNKDGEIVEWISRSRRKINLVGKTPTKNIIKLPNDVDYALDFHKNRYVGAKLAFMINDGCGFLCVTFRTPKGEEQTLISNYEAALHGIPYNEISVDASTIFINGFNKDKKPVSVPIKHDCRQWTTLYIDWSIDDLTISGSFIVNNDRTLSDTFNFQMAELAADYIVVGCRGDINTRPFTGSVSALELYTLEKEKVIPTVLRDLVIRNQLIESESEYSPPAVIDDLSDVEIYATDQESKLPHYLKRIIIPNQMVIPQDDIEPPVKKSKKNQPDYSV